MKETLMHVLRTYDAFWTEAENVKPAWKTHRERIEVQRLNQKVYGLKPADIITGARAAAKVFWTTISSK